MTDPSRPAPGGSDFAVTIADVAAELPAGYVAAWCAVLDAVPAPQSVAVRRPQDVRSVEAALINARPGHLVAAAAHRLAVGWWAGAPHLPGAAVALALRSAAHVHDRAADRRTELVISGPISGTVPIRLTSSVVVEVIRVARESLLVVSFAAYRVPEVVTELLAAVGRGVRVDLVLETAAVDGGALRDGTGAAAAFARLRDRAVFWHWPADQRRTAGSSVAALHAKLIAADTRAALISSANLTARALSSNLEVGVVLRDPDQVRRLVRHFTALMDPRLGALRRLP